MSLSTEERLDALERGLLQTNEQIQALIGSVSSALARIDTSRLDAGIEANRDAIGRNTRHLVNIEQRLEGLEQRLGGLERQITLEIGELKTSQQLIIDLLTNRGNN